MKANILKHTGLTEKQFYAKYKTKKAFDDSKEGKSFKKAQYGATLDKNNNGVLDNLEPINMNAIGQTQNWADTQGYGTPIQDQRQYQTQYENAIKRPQLTPASLITPAGSTNPLATGNVNGNSAFDVSGLGYQGPQKKDGPDVAGNIMGGITGIKDAFDAHKENIKLSEKMETWADVSDVQKRAGISNAFAEKPKNQWFRPDDNMFIQNANELYNPLGRGSDAITQNGGRLQGGGEIQNTYAPNTLYDDLGYEPLNDSDNVKAYQGGGGFGNFFGQVNSSLGGGSTFGSNIGVRSPFDSMVAGNSTGANLAGSIGSLFGPGVGLAATMFGRMVDKQPGRQRAAENTMTSNNAFASRINTAQGITGGLSNMGVGQNGQALQPYEDGGWVSNDWQPQVIASFGGLDEQEVYDYAHEGMDSLRAGGNLREYTPPSDRAMETYAMGGQLKTHWGGEAETISYNPYMPGSGEMVKLNGAYHNNDGIGISYGGEQGGSQQTAKAGANTGASIEAEGRETIMEMQEGGEIDPQTGKAKTTAVVLGNIAPSADIVKATGDQVLIDLFNKNPKTTFKRIGEVIAKDENKAASYMEIASNKANKADKTKWGKLETETARIMEDAAETMFKLSAQQRMKSANLQSAVNDTKKDISYMKGKNISAEELGKGKIANDYDPITMDAPLETSYAKNGAYLRKAQSGETTAAVEEPSITEEQYNNFVKLYEEGKNTKSKKSPSIKNFQHLYHQSFPKEALAAIQKTTKENGLSNKAKAMGLTVEDIASGKDVNKILESNEDEYFGPRTEQYMAKIASRFKKTPELGLTPLATKTTPTATTTDKKGIDVVPLKENKLGQYADMLRQFMPQDKLPGIDPRQFAGEWMAMAQNQPVPVPMQQASVQLDPITRMSYQDSRNENTASFRDALRQLGGNQAAVSGLLGGMYKANQPIYGEEFRTNQGLEDRIYGGNRAKVNQNMLTNIGLNVDQMDKQNLALSKTKETNQKAIASIADKYLQHDARNLEYNIKSNLFPTYRYNAAGRINTQGPGFRPNIPQVYGGKSNIQEVPVYKADGTIDHYKMQEYDPNAQQAVTKNGGSVNKKNKGSVVKNAKNGSIVKLHKNF